MKTLSKNSLKDRVAVILGTRPGIIKMSPIVRELKARDIPHDVIHTGQHYSENMDKVFFEDLKLDQPSYLNAGVDAFRTHAGQTGNMMVFVESVLFSTRPKLVMVGGDANTNFAGAVASRKIGLGLCHLEAGLRSRDWRMPEEHNRVMIDHISDILFAPTETARDNLINEKVLGNIYLVGNTIVDAVDYNLKLAEDSTILEDLGLRPKKYVVLTLHREENVDDPALMSELFEKLEGVYCRSCSMADLPVVFPAHPRTKSKEWFDRLRNYYFLRVIDPLGYLDFLKLLKWSRYVLTDSGGVQEEACIMQVPCLTLRESTERPETVRVGANMVVGSRGERIHDGIKRIELENKDRRGQVKWISPLGSGDSAKLICNILEQELGS